MGEYDEQELITGEFNPEVLRVIKSQGRKANDIIRLQDPFNFLVSHDLKLELELSKLTGWKTYPIQTCDFNDSYFGFQCLGKCGPPKRPDKPGFVSSFHFDLKSWNGSDFFIPETTLMIICTERAKKILVSRKIKTIELVPLDELQWYSV